MAITPKENETTPETIRETNRSEPYSMVASIDGVAEMLRNLDLPDLEERAGQIVEKMIEAGIK